MIDTSLKSKKLDDNTILHYVEHTNDPVAITKSIPDRWSKNKKIYTTTWHPDFRAMYPVVDQMRNKNFSVKESASDVASHVYHKYAGIADVPEDKLRDPLQAEHIGEVSVMFKSDYGDESDERRFNNYALKDSEGNHIANLRISPEYEHYTGQDAGKFSSNKITHLKFPDHVTVINSEAYKTAKAKHPGNDPISLMSRARYWHENKDKEPNFRGKWAHKEGSVSHKVYSTKLSPEDASAAYEKHLRDTNQIEGTLTRHSPTFFTMHKVGVGYSKGTHHSIDSSTPGELVHHSSTYGAPTEYDKKQLNQVIE